MKEKATFYFFIITKLKLFLTKFSISKTAVAGEDKV